MTTIQQQILDLCEETDRILWNAYNDDYKSHLIFPNYHSGDKKRRISEQEARFAFVEAILRNFYKYSIETPTQKKYNFTESVVVDDNKNERSAQTDLTVFDANKKHICNVEFKSKGFSKDAQNLRMISKDIEKLMREPFYGLWFHILESTDNSTLQDLLDAFLKCIGDFKSNPSDVDSLGLTIHICVLKHGFSIHCNLVDFHFHKFEYEVSRSHLRSGDSANGWTVHRSQRSKPSQQV